jgi:hypothetical protein
VGPDARVLPFDAEKEWGDEGLPDFVKPRLLRDGDEPPATVFTFRPFDWLAGPLKEAYLAGRTRIVPSPASLVFFWHHAYRRLAGSLARAQQISRSSTSSRARTTRSTSGSRRLAGSTSTTRRSTSPATAPPA